MLPILCLTFALAAGAGQADREGAAKQGALPSGTNVMVALDAAIDEKAVQLGDAISATVSRDVKAGGKVLVPKKAKLHGKVTRFRRHEIGFHNNSAVRFTWYEVGVLFDRIEAGGEQIPFVATLEEAGGKIFEDYFVPFSHSADKWGKWQRVQVSMNIADPQKGEGVIGVVQNYMRMPKGLPMTWRTE